jgi:hypothetical protein
MGRTPYWQIDYGILIDLLAIPVAVTFCYGVIRHWCKIQSGLFRFRLTWDDVRHGLRRERLGRFLWTGVLGSRVYRKAVTGFFHAMVFWGMLVLFLGTLMVLLTAFYLPDALAVIRVCLRPGPAADSYSWNCCC